jgi:hypothetical protein
MVEVMRQFAELRMVWVGRRVVGDCRRSLVVASARLPVIIVT